MHKVRVQTGVVLGAVLVAAIIWAPAHALVLLLMAVAGAATWEFFSMLDRAALPNFRWFGVLGGMALVAVSGWSERLGLGSSNLGEWCIVLVVVVGVFIRQFPQKYNEQPLVTMGMTLLGFFYVPFLFNFLTRLLMMGEAPDGRWLILYMILVVKCTDIGAYFIGCAFGRHKMFPRVSPAKSWEGTLGGILTALVVSVASHFVTRGDLGVVELRLTDAVVLGLLLGILGVVGDLAESLVKRAAGVKDSGSTVRGMGGLLDVLDSLLFAAPALYVYVRLFMTF